MNGGSKKWRLYWDKTLFPYFDGYNGNISHNYTFNFNIHDACLILRRILDCFIRGTKKSYLLGIDISSSRLIMFFNIPQNLKQIFERKQLRPISRHRFSLLKEKKYFLRLPLRLEVAERPEIILLKKISDIKNNFIGAI